MIKKITTIFLGLTAFFLLVQLASQIALAVCLDSNGDLIDCPPEEGNTGYSYPTPTYNYPTPDSGGNTGDVYPTPGDGGGNTGGSYPTPTYDYPTPSYPTPDSGGDIGGGGSSGSTCPDAFDCSIPTAQYECPQFCGDALGQETCAGLGGFCPNGKPYDVVCSPSCSAVPQICHNTPTCIEFNCVTNGYTCPNNTPSCGNALSCSNAYVYCAAGGNCESDCSSCVYPGGVCSVSECGVCGFKNNNGSCSQSAYCCTTPPPGDDPPPTANPACNLTVFTYWDKNGNGSYLSPDAPLSGVATSLSPGSAGNTTEAGTYTYTNLSSGQQYAWNAAPPAGYTATTATNGSYTGSANSTLNFQAVVNVYEKDGSQCTGVTPTPSDWTSCGATSKMTFTVSNSDTANPSDPENQQPGTLSGSVGGPANIKSGTLGEFSADVAGDKLDRAELWIATDTLQNEFPYDCPGPVTGPWCRIGTNNLNGNSGSVDGAYTPNQTVGTCNVSVGFEGPPPPGNSDAWWQVKDSDLSSTGDLRSSVPSGLSFSLNGTGGYPGIPAYSGTLNLGSGSVSSNNWKANSGFTGRRWDYTYFTSLAPPEVFTDSASIINSSSINASELRNGYQKDGYTWRYRNGDLTINGTTNLTSAKIILIVNGNLTIGNNITLTDGQGFFSTIVKGNTTLAPQVSHPNDVSLEGMFMSDGTFSTGEGSGRLYLRGAVAAWGGVNLQRDLGNSNSDTAAEFIEYAPDMILTFPRELLRTGLVWREIVP